jgi:hypothetical protein
MEIQKREIKNQKVPKINQIPGARKNNIIT